MPRVTTLHGQKYHTQCIKLVVS